MEIESPPVEINFSVRIDGAGARQLARLLFEPGPHSAAERPAPDNDKLLTTEETAELLGVSKSSLYSLRYYSKAPPAIKVGNRLRWRRSDINTWMDEQLEERTTQHW